MIYHGPILKVLLFSTSPFYYFGHGPGTRVAGYTAIVSTLRTGIVKLHIECTIQTNMVYILLPILYPLMN